MKKAQAALALALLGAVCSLCLRGLKRIDTNARNSIARAFYKGLGYREIAVVPTTFNGIPGIDLVLLEKHLEAMG